MQFCINCGSEISTNHPFCTNCGVVQHQQADKPTLTPNVELTQEIEVTMNEGRGQAPNPKKPMSKKTKIGIGIAAAICVGLFGTKYVLDSQNDPQKTLNDMNRAFVQGEMESFYEYFEIPENTIGSAETFYEWFDDEDWKDILSDIEESLKGIERGRGIEAIDIGYEDALILKEEKVLFGLSKKVVFEIKPLTVSLSSNLVGAELTVNKKTIKTTDKLVELGNFIPGQYEVAMAYKGDYAELKDKYTMHISSYDGQEVEKYIEIDYDKVHIESDVEDAILYINDKSTKKKLSELNEIYPVTLDGKTKVHLVYKDQNGKEIKSSVYPIDSAYMNIEFDEVEEIDEKSLTNDVQGDYRSSYQQYRSNFEKALNAVDFSYVESYFIEDSQMMRDYKTFVEDHSSIAGSNYDFISNEIGSETLLENGDIELTINEIFDYYSNEDGTYHYDRDKRYVIRMTDEGMKIISIEDIGTKKNK